MTSRGDLRPSKPPEDGDTPRYAHGRQLRTLAFDALHQSVLFACGSHELDDDELDVYLHFVHARAARWPDIRVLVASPVVQPSAAQRKRLTDAMDVYLRRGNDIRAAILTDSASVRAAVTALSWFSKGVYVTFPTSAVSEAIDYLGLSVHSVALRRRLSALQHHLSGVRVVSESQ